MEHKKILFVGGTTLAIFALYLPVLLNGQFLFDDFSSIVDNPAIRSLDIRQIASFSVPRFIGYLSFAINFHFSNLNPYSYHMVNVCIHILFVTLYFLFIQALWQTPSGKAANFSDNEKENLSMAAALLLAVHPMSSFAVAYIVQRLASLAAFFYMASLFFYIKIRLADTLSKKIKYILPFVLFILCAVFTKQNAFTVFPMIILMELFCFNLTKKKIILFLSGIGFFFVVFIFLAMSNVMNLNEIRELTYETKDITRLEYFTGQFPVLCFYLSQIFFPNRLAIDYQSLVYSSFNHPDIVISAFILFFIILCAILMGFKKQFRLAGFGLLFYFTAISIESSIFPIRDLVFIHRTYLPNAGMFFSVVILVYMFMKRIRFPLYLSGIILGLSVFLCAAVTWKTVHIFQNPLKVWQRVVEISPDHGRGYSFIGIILISQGQYDEAEKNFLEALRLGRLDLREFSNLGVLYSKTGQYEKAIDLYKKIIRYKKNFVLAYINLGNTYSDNGNYDLAIETYRKGYKYNPDNFEILLNLGQHLAFAGADQPEKLQEALKFLDLAQKINLLHPVVYYSKGIAFLNLKDYDQAKKNFRQALNLNPDLMEARMELEAIE